MKSFPEVFSIIDTETTGMRPGSSRIIDIGIIRVEGGKVVERYQTLLNPGIDIPNSIKYLTHIRTEDVQDAPTFEEVALKVEELLAGAVFVAHNVSFDYRFIQSEFRRIGKTFTAPTLCTVQLSRKLYPGAQGHSLDALMTRHGFTCATRHRALPDAEVLLDFIQYVSQAHTEEELERTLDSLLNGPVRSKKYASGAGLERTAFSHLPENAGVYFFYGEDNELLYVGKSKHVKTRARSHFHTSDDRKEQRLQEETASIETISTSGELSALLLESALIKKESPLYNRALRKRRLLVIARRIFDEAGYARVTLSRTETISPDQDILGVFRTLAQAKSKLRDIAKEQQLCAKLLGIEAAPAACFGSQLNTCDGACSGKVVPELYNARVDAAFARRKVRTWPYKGVVQITEQESEDSGTVFFIRDWVLVGSYQYQGGEFQPLISGDGNFDYDQYKILVRFMLDPKNKRAVQVLSELQFRRQLAQCTGSYEQVVA